MFPFTCRIFGVSVHPNFRGVLDFMNSLWAPVKVESLKVHSKGR